MNRQERRAQNALNRNTVSKGRMEPIDLDAPEGPPCGCGPSVGVDVTEGAIGRYAWAVAGQPGCLWTWWVEDDEEPIAEGSASTRDEAVFAATMNARAFVAVDARDGHPWDGKPH